MGLDIWTAGQKRHEEELRDCLEPAGQLLAFCFSLRETVGMSSTEGRALLEGVALLTLRAVAFVVAIPGNTSERNFWKNYI